MIIYISGVPGCGKSTIVNKFKENNYKTYNELVNRFPIEKYPNPRSFETANYIFEENIKRDRLLRKEKGIVIVDRHPMECLIIAKGLLKNSNDFNKIKKLYEDYDFVKGKIIKLIITDKISKQRYESKNIDAVKEDMIKDIIKSFKGYSGYLTPNLEVDSNKETKNIYKIIEDEINDWKNYKK